MESAALPIQITGPAGRASYAYEVFQDYDGSFRWRLIGPDARIIARAATQFVTRRGARRAAEEHQAESSLEATILDG